MTEIAIRDIEAAAERNRLVWGGRRKGNRFQKTIVDLDFVGLEVGPPCPFTE